MLVLRVLCCDVVEVDVGVDVVVEDYVHVGVDVVARLCVLMLICCCRCSGMSVVGVDVVVLRCCGGCSSCFY